MIDPTVIEDAKAAGFQIDEFGGYVGGFEHLSSFAQLREARQQDARYWLEKAAEACAEIELDARDRLLDNGKAATAYICRANILALIEPLSADEPVCDECKGAGQVAYGISGLECDGNAIEYVRCPSCGYGDASQQSAYNLQDNEQYRMQMAGISAAALGYWKENDDILPNYDTLALRDVAALYKKYVSASTNEKDAERYRFLRNEAYEAVVPHGAKIDGKRTAWITKLHSGDSFDSAIDAALSATQEKKA